MLEGTKIYCFRCMELVLTSSGRMRWGGPYSGDMFAPVTEDTNFRDYFNFGKGVVGGDLVCPRCTQNFIDDDGCILTEFGSVHTKQGLIDRNFKIIYEDGPYKNMIKKVEPSREPDRRGPVGARNPFLNGSIANPGEKAVPKYTCKKCGEKMFRMFDHRERCP